MKTSILKKLIFIFMTLLVTGVGFVSCSEEEILEEDFLGTTSTTTNNSITEITITQNSNAYNFKCYFLDSRNDEAKEYNWYGTFKNIPSDIIKNSNNEEIGEITITKEYIKFEAYTQREGIYKAYKDDLADLNRSRNSTPNDSIIVETDSIK